MDRHRLDSLRRMASERPADARVRFGLAVELLGAGHTEEGIEALRDYLSMEGRDGSAWGRLGGALDDLGDHEAAAEAYRRGLAVAREHGHGSLVRELEEALKDTLEDHR